jgi:GT2 family glycosyltransferase
MRDLVLGCLETLAVEAPEAWELIVVVNSDPDRTVAAISQRFQNVRLIVNRVNRGVSAARNQGIEAAKGEVIVLLDADTTVPPGAMRGLVQALLNNPAAGVVGPRLVSPRGEPQATARRFPTLLTKIRRRAPRPLRRLLPHDAIDESNMPKEVGYVIGACQAIRQEALQDVGILDERIFYGPEDVDLCLRMWKGGWRVIWDPRYSIVHHEQRATRRRVFSVLMLRHAMGLVYFFIKHRYLLHPPTFGNKPAHA